MFGKNRVLALYFWSKTFKFYPLIELFLGPLKREKSNLTAASLTSNILRCVRTNIDWRCNIDASALSRPGMLVPSATKAMALTESLRKMKQPRWPATSLMSAVMKAIMAMDRTKVP